MIKLKDLLPEGIQDKGIFKAVFTAGGPGSGKSYVASNLFGMPEKMPFMSASGLKGVNSDSAFEAYMQQAKLTPDLQKLNIPKEDEYAELYYKKTGRTKIQNWDFYMAYNIFRLAGIAQGIVGRVRDGTASSAQAKEYESFVPILGKLGWNIVERLN